MYYAKKSDGSKVEFNKLPNAYFLSGYHDKNDAGKLYISIFDNGTVLTPLYHKNGKTIKMVQYAGKEVVEVGGVDKISKEIESGKFYESKAEPFVISKRQLPTFEAYCADKSLYTMETLDGDINQLPDEYDQSGIAMKMMDRSEKAAIYRNEDGTYFEVFIIKVSDPEVITTGQEPMTIKPTEQLPTTDDFGTTAWSFDMEQSAIDKFNEFK